MKNYQNAKAVPEKYRWDLKAILKDKDASFYFDRIKEATAYLIANKQTFFESANQFKKYLETLEQKALASGIYRNWIFNNISINVVDDKYISMQQEYQFWSYQQSLQLSDWDNIVLKNEAKIKKLLNAKDFQHYQEYFDEIFRAKPHTLTLKEEKLASLYSRALNDNVSIFSTITNSELNFEKVKDQNNKLVKISHGNFPVLLKSKDRVLRKNVYHEYWNKYLVHRQSLSRILFEHKKQESAIAKIRHYKSSVEMLTFDDHVDDSLLQTLYKVVAQNSHLVVKFKKIWNSNFLAKFKFKPQPWDTRVELLNVDRKFSVEQAQDLVLKALKPLGKKYQDVLKEAYQNKWIDYMPIDNKRTGAYSIGDTYGTSRKYILMNFDGTLRSVETLAHELGHSLHSYFSDQNNTYVESQYEILVAEIASIFNELMLSDYLLKNAKSEREELYILEKLITNFFGTMHRQTLWSDYEYQMYQKIDKGEPLATYEAQSKIYQEVCNKYSGQSKPLKQNLNDKVASFYVPHFYYGFYVYKYAIGLAGAYAFFAKYQKNPQDTIDNYINNFLSKGGVGKPIDRLKAAGVDLKSIETMQMTFDVLSDFINRYNQLSKKVFK